MPVFSRRRVVLSLGAAAVPALWLAWGLVNLGERSDNPEDLLARRCADAFIGSPPDQSAIVADGARLGELISRRIIEHRKQAGPAISLIPPDGDAAREHFARGDAVFSSRRARAILELQGLRFERVEECPLFRLIGVETCADVAAGRWADLTSPGSGGRLSGRLRPGSTAAAELVIYAARERALSPRLTASAAVQEPVFIVDRLDRVEDGAELEAAIARDGIPLPPRPEDTIYRLALRASGASSQLIFRIDFGGLPSWTVAAVQGVDGAMASATICPFPLAERALFDNPKRVETVRVGDETFFGDGWHAPERVGTPDEFRWTAARDAEVMIPMPRESAVRLRFRARPGAPPEASPTLAVRVNETQLMAQPMRSGESEYEWAIPAAALREGINQIFIQSSLLTVPRRVGESRRRLGVAVQALTLELVSEPLRPAG